MKFRGLLILTVALMAASSCESEKMITNANQEEAIEKYITETMQEHQSVRYGNSTRIIIAAGDGENFVESGDNVTAVMDGRIFSNGPGTSFCYDTLSFIAGSGRFVAGLDPALVGASKGETSYIVFSTKYGFYDETVGVVPPMSPLLYIVEILDIQ